VASDERRNGRPPFWWVLYPWRRYLCSLLYIIKLNSRSWYLEFCGTKCDVENSWSCSWFWLVSLHGCCMTMILGWAIAVGRTNANDYGNNNDQKTHKNTMTISTIYHQKGEIFYCSMKSYILIVITPHTRLLLKLIDSRIGRNVQRLPLRCLLTYIWLILNSILSPLLLV